MGVEGFTQDLWDLMGFEWDCTGVFEGLHCCCKSNQMEMGIYIGVFEGLGLTQDSMGFKMDFM